MDQKQDKSTKKIRTIFIAGAVLLVLIVGYVAKQHLGELKNLFGLAEEPTIDLTWGNASQQTFVDLFCPATSNGVAFNATLTNYGDIEATGVTVRLYPSRPGAPGGPAVDETMPDGSTFTVSQGDYDPGALVWTVGTLAANGGRATIRADIPVAVAQGFNFEAEVDSADQQDIDSVPDSRGNAPDEDDTLKLGCAAEEEPPLSPPPPPPPPTPQADVSLTKVANPTAVQVNQNSTFSIAVKNSGPDATDNVSVKDTLPSGVTFVSAAVTSGSYNQQTGVWTIGAMAKDAVASLSLVAKFPTVGSFINTAEVISSSVPDPDSTPNNHVATEDDQASATVTVTQAPPPPEDPNVVCSPATQTVQINHDASFSATGGNGIFAWTATGGDPASGSGASFTTKYSLIGANTVTVTSGSKQGSCSVNVTDTPPPPTPQADLSLTKVAGNTTPQLNSEFTYSIVLSNAGPNTATNVTVGDLLPSGVTFVSASSTQGTYDSATGVWTIGSVPVSATPSLIITAKATTVGTIVNTAEVTASGLPDPDSTPNNHVATEDDQASATVTVINPGCTVNCGGGNTVDVGITKAQTKDAPLEGDSVTYAMVVTNHGPLGATGVTVNDIVPNTLKYIASTATQGTYDNGTGVWTIGSLANGEMSTLTITVTVNDNTAGDSITNTATVTMNEPDSNAANNTASVTLVPRAPRCTSGCGGGGSPRADLSLTKVATNPTPKVGQAFSYSIVLVNSGPDSASNVTVGDILPNSLTFISASATQGSYDQASGVWTVGTLRDGDSTTLTISVSSSATGSITNTAEVTASSRRDPDSTPNNHDPDEDDQDSATVIVGNSGGGNPVSADLSLTKSVNDAAPFVGQHITYTVTVINNGPVTATGVSVKDLIPSQLSFSRTNASQGSYDSATGIWSVGTLAVGNSATLQLSVTVKNTGTINNTAEVYTSDQPDPDSIPNNNNLNEDDQGSVVIKPRPKAILPAAGSAGTLPVVFGFSAIAVAAAVHFRRRSLLTRHTRSGAIVMRSYNRYD